MINPQQLVDFDVELSLLLQKVRTIRAEIRAIDEHLEVMEKTLYPPIPVVKAPRNATMQSQGNMKGSKR